MNIKSPSVPRRSVLAGTGAALAATGVPFCAHAAPGGQPISEGIKPQQMVDALYKAFGDNHSRAVHAKGIMLEGRFEPAAGARTLTSAPIFRQDDMPVLARFSNFTGIPTIPDTIGDANPRGFALKFRPADETELDVVAHSFDGFPTKTAAEFRDLLLAIAASGKDAPKPSALDRFLEGHPIARTFLTTQKPPAVSYATLRYFGVNAFEFTNIAGRSLHVRYRFAPHAGEQFLDAAALASKGPDYLQQEIGERIAKGPILFDWQAQIAEPGDAFDDPSLAWPSSRQLQMLGTIKLTGLAAQPLEADHKTLFLPANLPDGIRAADPMLMVRNGAYPLSYRHRQ